MCQGGFFTEVMSDIQDVYRAFFVTRPMVHIARATKQVSVPPGTPGQAAGEAATDAEIGEKWKKLHSTTGFFDKPHVWK